MGAPNIVVEFLTKANTAITRSERGIVCLVVSDTTKTTRLTEYKSLTEIVETDWTAENLQIIKDALADGPNKVYVVRIGTSETFETIEPTLDALKINWIAHIAQDQTDIVEYVKTRNLGGGSAAIKAVVYSQTADDIHVVNFANTKVTRTDGTELAGYKFLGRIAGMLAATPLDRSATYYIFDDLQSVEEPADIDDAVDAGNFVLCNDYGTVKVVRAVNSATKVEKEDLKKITIVEGMDLMKEDIMETFKNQYVGKYKNNLDNQMVFIAAVNTYFRQLALDEVLNPDYANLAEIDVETQRTALANAGTTEALDWDDDTVKKNPFRSYVFAKANVQLSDAIEDLEFDIYLN